MSTRHTTVNEALKAFDEQGLTAVDLLLDALRNVQRNLTEVVEEESVKGTYLGRLLRSLLEREEANS
jgi:bifunctional DNase/RNase